MTRFKRIAYPDFVAILILIGLWLFFFWRLFTPVEADQASLKKGDFSGQFVAFAAYQYERFAVGEVPLWDPYNNGGLPFIGDTQAAVFYPPRLITIGMSRLADGWTYHALELEMTFHVLLCSLFMYALVRRMTTGQRGSPFGALVAAIIFSYGGFLSSYPPLQLALLEAAIWLPLGLLGIWEATKAEKIRPGGLLVTGFALGISWMAGHPQTSWFQTYLLTAFFGYRVYERRYRWPVFAGGTLLFGVMAGGLAAVQLLPGMEYLTHTARTGLGFDAKGNGFPFQDVAQFIFPGIVSLWSPLYVGLVGLTLAAIAVWRRLPSSIFWGGVAIIALGLSFGANSPVFALLYNILPGMRFFRGQERGAYLVSLSLAILAGMGGAHLVDFDKLQDFKAALRIRQALLILLVICTVFAGAMLIAWLGNSEAFGKYIVPIAFSALTAALVFFVFPRWLNAPTRLVSMGLVLGLIVFELFGVSLDKDSNFDHQPPTKQLSLTPPPLIATALSDNNIPFRVDGYRGLHDNYGSLYNLADMRGISPLFLDNVLTIQQGDLINPRAWELMAVRYVYSDWAELPVSSTIIASGQDRYSAVNLHLLTDARPFATLIYDTQMAANDSMALAMAINPQNDVRHTVILSQPTDLSIDGGTSEMGKAEVTLFKPEQFSIHVETPANAILSLSHPDYPGWQATLDGETVPILRAYGALSAVEIPSGEHTVEFTYNPLSYRLGVVISLLMWIGTGILVIVLAYQSRKRYAASERTAKLD